MSSEFKSHWNKEGEIDSETFGVYTSVHVSAVPYLSCLASRAHTFPKELEIARDALSGSPVEAQVHCVGTK